MGIDAPTSSHFSRRELLAGAGSSLLLAASPLGVNASATKPHPAPAEADGKSFDLLIKRGKVIDPSQAVEEVRDVAIREGKIARLEHDIPADQARQVIDATGKIVTPLIRT
jgi:dihydroorotase